jgi:hypothetical protein
MNTTLHSQVVSRWVRLGAMLNVQESSGTPDIERLLLDTARVTEGNARLFILAASWLVLYGELVDSARLAQLIGEELDVGHRPTLGLLLEWVESHSAGGQFDAAIQACGRAIDDRPLFDVERRNKTFVELAKLRATPLSRKWGRWMGEFQPKVNALRPMQWILRQNPSLVRSTRKSDPRQSIA